MRVRTVTLWWHAPPLQIQQAASRFGWAQARAERSVKITRAQLGTSACRVQRYGGSRHRFNYSNLLQL
ncbi:hypothetical protein NDU88_004344 [Pleurodeles waltl]|uniref:Secreted protein n=1 Tax=Pleurodeles waltl TaxID=8319 RepID=A0AAV7WVE2_PLEWA|nr:hypothetical protein NDU88_004344 [Pleurodeles waltl]